MRKIGHTVYTPNIDEWFKDTPMSRRNVMESDLVVVERVLVEEALDRARYWRGMKKPLVTDGDDSYHRLESYSASGNLASAFWHDGEVEISHPTGVKYKKKLDRHPREQFIEGCKIITGLTTPSKFLCKDWSVYAPTWFVPNYIDSARYIKYASEIKPDPNWITIGYGGSLSHLNSFKKSGVLRALERVFQKRKNVRFLLAGDERLYKMLPIASGQKVFQPYTMWMDWPKVVARFDISIAPLFGEYDWSRSAIKCEEAGLMRKPILYTGCPTYQDFMDVGYGEWVNDGPYTPEAMEQRAQEWEVKLLDMIDNLADYNKKADAAFEWVYQNWDVDLNIHKIVATYEEIIRRG